MLHKQESRSRRMLQCLISQDCAPPPKRRPPPRFIPMMAFSRGRRAATKRVRFSAAAFGGRHNRCWQALVPLHSFPRPLLSSCPRRPATLPRHPWRGALLPPTAPPPPRPLPPRRPPPSPPSPRCSPRPAPRPGCASAPALTPAPSPRRPAPRPAPATAPRRPRSSAGCSPPSGAPCRTAPRTPSQCPPGEGRGGEGSVGAPTTRGIATGLGRRRPGRSREGRKRGEGSSKPRHRAWSE